MVIEMECFKNIRIKTAIGKIYSRQNECLSRDQN